MYFGYSMLHSSKERRQKEIELQAKTDPQPMDGDPSLHAGYEQTDVDSDGFIHEQPSLEHLGRKQTTPAPANGSVGGVRDGTPGVGVGVGVGMTTGAGSEQRAVGHHGAGSVMSDQQQHELAQDQQMTRDGYHQHSGHSEHHGARQHQQQPQQQHNQQHQEAADYSSSRYPFRAVSPSRDNPNHEGGRTGEQQVPNQRQPTTESSYDTSMARPRPRAAAKSGRQSNNPFSLDHPPENSNNW